MAYSIPAFRIQEIVRGAKCLQNGEEWKDNGESPEAKYDVRLSMMDEGPLDLRLRAVTSDVSKPKRYDASLILAGERIRGIGFNESERRLNYGKIKIPAGWHQNIVDPNFYKGHNNYNRHDPLQNFNPKNFDDFVKLVTKLWSIELVEEETTI